MRLIEYDDSFIQTEFSAQGRSQTVSRAQIMSYNSLFSIETELENRVQPHFGFERPSSNRFWNPNDLLG